MTFPTANITGWAGLVAIGTILATCWRYIITFGRYLVGLVIGTTLLKEEAAKAVMSYCMSNSIRSPLGMRVFGGYDGYIHPKRQYEVVGYESIGKDPFLVRYKKHYLLVSIASKTDTDDDNIKNDAIIKIKYFRWFFKPEQFITDALENYNSIKRQKDVGLNGSIAKVNRFKIVRMGGETHTDEPRSGNAVAASSINYSHNIESLIISGVYRLLKWKIDDLQQKPEKGQSPFTAYPFPDEVKESIKELDRWINNEKWFRSKSIPWRRGWLLHGVPGSGKTTLCRAIGMSFNLPIYIFDLTGMTNYDFTLAWDNMLTNTPCIALIEDIDSIFNGREFVGNTVAVKGMQRPNVTFDCLLNCISGVKQADGVFLVITTNHLDKIDPALGIPDKNGNSTRPGRIDVAIHLGLMKEPQRLELAKFILSDYPELIEQTVKDGEGETSAQFQARCARVALDKFWTDDRFKDTKPDTLIEVSNFSIKEEIKDTEWRKNAQLREKWENTGLLTFKKQSNTLYGKIGT